METNKDIVIIIPTNGRQNYLNRVAYYYSQFSMDTYICDAYQTRYKIDYYDKIHYLWDPNKGFFEEIIDVIEKTDAKYYVLSPDDDFIKYETCIECHDEMEKDETILLSTGRQLFFHEEYDGQFIYYNAHNRLASSKKQLFDKADYKSFWRGYQNIHWSLFRRDFLLNTLKKLEYAKYNNANFTELTMGFEALLNGKILMSPNFFNYREESTKPHWGTIATVTNWRNFVFTSELHSDVKKLKKIYNSDFLFVLRSLYYFLGEPSIVLKRKMKYMLGWTNKPLLGGGN